ncbi:MAG: hypothetical protein AABY22_10465 [Nanoarchaeota archaeon]
MTNEKEYNNITYVKKLSSDIIEAINACDIDRIKEIKGELKAMESVVSPLEMTMGMIVGALSDYQRKTKIFEYEEDEEQEEKKSKK